MNANQDLFNDIEKVAPGRTNRDVAPDTPSIDDIIELTDVIQEGETATESSDVPMFLDSEEPDDVPVKITENATPAEATLQSVPVEELNDFPEMDSEDAFSALESSDFEFETAPEFEEDDDKPFPELPHEDLDHVLAGIEKEETERPEDLPAGIEEEETNAEKAEDILAGFAEIDEDEKPDDVLACLEGKETKDEKPADSAFNPDIPGIPGISEEKMKELLTGIIQETVDKAIRETVSEVAEKVIREAIASLKQSIESSGK